jgi:hypothetical protein
VEPGYQPLAPTPAHGADGTIHLYRSQEYFLTWQNPEVRMHIELPPLVACAGFAYYY